MKVARRILERTAATVVRVAVSQKGQSLTLSA
jgi:hypothetical protein